jgi:hypothetical protein
LGNEAAKNENWAMKASEIVYGVIKHEHENWAMKLPNMKMGNEAIEIEQRVTKQEFGQSGHKT